MISLCFGGSASLTNPVSLAPGVLESVFFAPDGVDCSSHYALLSEEGQGLTVFESFSNRMEIDVFLLKCFSPNI